jgi:hypothetical protein
MTDRNSDSPAASPSGNSGAGRAATIDWTGLESRYARRPTFVDRLADVAASTMRDVPAQLRAGADAGRTTEIAAMAHSLRTGTDVIMAYAARDLATAVEAACLAGAADAVPLARSLAEHVDRLLASLQTRLGRASP